MAINEMLLSEFDHEMSIARKFLERAPSEKFSWKPHEKSMTMGQLVGHIAEIPSWVVPTLEMPSLDLAPKDGPAYQMPKIGSSAEAVQILDKYVAAARPAISKITEVQLAEPWSLMKTGVTLFTMPKGLVLRNFVLNHVVHHRAQLGVYFRLNDIPVPQTYGPSADDTAM